MMGEVHDRVNPYDSALDENSLDLKITDQHREIAAVVYNLKQHLGPLGMIESALAIYDQIERLSATYEECARIADQIEREADRLAADLTYGELYGMQCRAETAEEIASAIRAMRHAK